MNEVIISTPETKIMNRSTMQAVVCTGYGSPEQLQIQEIPKPVPQENEILVKVIATPVSTADTMMRKGTPFYARFFLGLFKPKYPIMGTSFTGVVEAIGDVVTNFQIGDEVFGESGLTFSSNAEYVCVAADGVIMPKPNNVSFEEAAPICDGALTSYNFLQNLIKVKAGQKVLINGASGSLGTVAVQLAKYFGAEVTGVCSARNVDLVKSLGADHVIDYTTTDFTKTGNQYDVIYDSIGKSSYSACKQALKEHGVYLSPVLSFPLLLQTLWTSKFGSKKAMFDATGLRPPEELKVMLQTIVELYESNRIHTVMDKTYPLAKAVEANRYVDTGRKRGSVVLVTG